MHLLGQLNEVASRVPHLGEFIKSYVIKEGVLSSAIEGIHTTIKNVFKEERSLEKSHPDTRLVSNYLRCLYTAWASLRGEKSLPVSSRVILAAHRELMQGELGGHADPGSYRKQQVSVKNLTPPLATRISSLMSDLEKFINEDKDIPPLIKAGLAHAQFEIIHPFLDGNGRIGRLLIVLMFLQEKILTQPLL